MTGRYQTIQAKVSAPGRIAFKRWHRLADPTSATNASEPVSSNNGAHHETPSSCTVAARANGVPHMWLKINMYYTRIAPNVRCVALKYLGVEYG